MKRLLSILLVIASIFTLCSCNKVEPERKDSSEALRENAKYLEFDLGDMCVDEELKYSFSVSSIQELNIENRKYIVLNVTFINNRNENDYEDKNDAILEFNLSKDIELYLDNEKVSCTDSPDIPYDMIDYHLYLQNCDINADRQASGYVFFPVYKAYSEVEIISHNIRICCDGRDFGEEIVPTPVPTEPPETEAPVDTAPPETEAPTPTPEPTPEPSEETMFPDNGLPIADTDGAEGDIPPPVDDMDMIVDCHTQTIHSEKVMCSIEWDEMCELHNFDPYQTYYIGGSYEYYVEYGGFSVCPICYPDGYPNP